MLRSVVHVLKVKGTQKHGEGRWTGLSAVEEGIPAPVLSAALYGRFGSRDRDDFANKVQSAMRSQFGGHDEKANPV